jgi:hypothetical protein
MTMPTGDSGDNGQTPEGDEPEGTGQQGGQQSEWKPPASQEELDRIITDRLKRETRKFRDYDSLKAKAEQYDSLAASVQTDQERAIAEAQEQAFNAAMGSVVPRLVRAEFKAAALGKLTGEQLETLLEDVDLTKYVDDDGEPDVDRIKRKVEALAPRTPPPSFGQGQRQQVQAPKSMNDLIRGLATKGTVTLSGRDL